MESKAGFYKFTIPTQLKFWIDRITIAGKTFQYSENVVEGLARSKRIIFAISHAGVYGPGMPTASFENTETYLLAVFGFLGI